MHYTLINFINKKTIVPIFFISLFILGLAIFKDYGVHWDEFSNQRFGIFALEYVSDVLSGNSLPVYNPTHNKEHHLTHGPIFEIFLAFMQKNVLNLTDQRDIIYMRHLFTFVLFYTAVFFFYLLCKTYFKSWKTGILGCLFLILHPRIFANSFYNSVDIAFLSFYIMSSYTLIIFLNRKTYSSAISHALTCAILVDIRIMGVVLPLCTFIFLLANLLSESKVGALSHRNKIIRISAVYIFSLIISTIIFWPMLWKNPIAIYLKAFETTATFRRQFLPISPWFYYPRWIFITTPLLYSFLFLVGFFTSMKALIKPAKYYPDKQLILTAFFLFVVPNILVILQKRTLFDGWRHFYFVFPIFLLFSLTGIKSLIKFIKIRFCGLSYNIAIATFLIIIVYSCINITWFMIQYHPHQFIYANMLAGKEMRRAKERYALDYWGLSYRKALEYILQNDERKIIKVCVANRPGRNNFYILSPNDRKRLLYVDKINGADYFLGNYKSSGKYHWNKGQYPKKKECYSIRIKGISFMVVYKLN